METTERQASSPKRREARLRCAVIAAAGALAAFVLLSGCAGSPEMIAPEQAPAPNPPLIRELAEETEAAYRVTEGVFASRYGCEVTYEEYHPDREARSAVVVIGHGFMRNLQQIRGWAELWASRGFRVGVIDFCNSSWFDGRHDRNAEDLRALADRMLAGGAGTQTGVIYAGHSAGGLSAWLAARRDGRTVAYLGLDAVDSDNLVAETQAATLESRPARAQPLPALFLFGEPSRCNAGNNMVESVRGVPGVSMFAVELAGHCDFEYPTDERCYSLCRKVEPERVARRLTTTIRGLATGWLLLHAGTPEERRHMRAEMRGVLTALGQGGNISHLD